MRLRSLSLVLVAVVGLAAHATADADNLGNLSRASGGTLRFKWKRGNLTMELHDGRARWTDEEAKLVRDSLDKLPDVLLERAIVKMEVKRFRRDHKPEGRNGPKDGASATTVIEQGYVSYGDWLFDGLDFMRVYPTVTHELGHCAQYSMIDAGSTWARMRTVTLGTPGWTSISWTGAILDGMKSWNGFVSDYARTNDREDFAESVEFYWVAPDELRRVSPAKYAFMHDRVFKGVVSPADARDPNHKAIDKVVPEITSLGDKEDDALSLVRVKGNRFMGVRDGGWNQVRYRGTKALHLAVSRTTVWSWVPGIKTGSAPITVTTQDGTSNAAAFTVTKPWWKFW